MTAMADFDDPVQLYTLEQAKQKLAELECRRVGHDLEQMFYRNAAGCPVIDRVYCSRCRVQFEAIPGLP